MLLAKLMTYFWAGCSSTLKSHVFNSIIALPKTQIIGFDPNYSNLDWYFAQMNRVWVEKLLVQTRMISNKTCIIDDFSSSLTIRMSQSQSQVGCFRFQLRSSLPLFKFGSIWIHSYICYFNTKWLFFMSWIS